MKLINDKIRFIDQQLERSSTSIPSTFFMIHEKSAFVLVQVEFIQYFNAILFLLLFPFNDNKAQFVFGSFAELEMQQIGWSRSEKEKQWNQWDGFKYGALKMKCWTRPFSQRPILNWINQSINKIIFFGLRLYWIRFNRFLLLLGINSVKWSYFVELNLDMMISSL